MKKYMFLAICMITSIPHLSGYDQNSMIHQYMFFDQTDKESQWMFLEKTFNTDIRNKNQAIWHNLSMIIPATLTSIAGYNFFVPKKSVSDLPATIGTEQSTQNQKPTEKAIKNMLNLDNMYLVGAISSTLIIGARLLQLKIHHQTNRQVVDEFFTNWEINSLYTPTELQGICSLIAKTMELEGKEAILEKADQIVDIINFLIIRHFEKRYIKLFELESCLNLNYEKSTSEILTSIAGTAKNLVS